MWLSLLFLFIWWLGSSLPRTPCPAGPQSDPAFVPAHVNAQLPRGVPPRDDAPVATSPSAERLPVPARVQVPMPVVSAKVQSYPTLGGTPRGVSLPYQVLAAQRHDAARRSSTGGGPPHKRPARGEGAGGEAVASSAAFSSADSTGSAAGSTNGPHAREVFVVGCRIAWSL